MGISGSCCAQDDQTPLHLAVSMGHLGVVHVLQKHINLVDTVDEVGERVLYSGMPLSQSGAQWTWLWDCIVGLML